MAQPLGLTAAQTGRYRDHLRTSHDYAIAADVLDLDGRVIASIEPTLLDGQVNLTWGIDEVVRTATFTFHDPDRTLHLDAFSPWEGALFLDRMIRVRHTVTVPGLGEVTAIPFVGPVVKLSRDGETVAAECQDKSSLAMTGVRPLTVRKGMNAVAAIRRILRQSTGERRFRFPAGVRVQLPRAYSVGWGEDATPWKVCQQIARLLPRMDLFYSADGYATIRRRTGSPALVVTGAHLTEPVKAEFDATEAKNRVMVRGTTKRRVRIPPRRRRKGQRAFRVVTTKIGANAQVGRGHPLHPNRIGRGGVPRFLPMTDDGRTYPNRARARQRASGLLARHSRMSATASVSTIPVFDLDVLDVVRVQTDGGMVSLRLTSASIPLGVSGEMSIGQTRNVARGRRA